MTTLTLSRAALDNVAETGIDPQDDIARLRAGVYNRESLLAHCLSGADEDRAPGWREYVDAVWSAAACSFKVEVIADSSGKWCGNALRFASEAAAKDYAEDLYMRWTLVQEWRVVPCADPPEPNCYEQNSEHAP